MSETRLYYLTDPDQTAQRIKEHKRYNTIQHLYAIYESQFGPIGFSYNEFIEKIFNTTGAKEIPFEDAIRQTIKNGSENLKHLYGNRDILSLYKKA